VATKSRSRLWRHKRLIFHGDFDGRWQSKQCHWCLARLLCLKKGSGSRCLFLLTRQRGDAITVRSNALLCRCLAYKIVRCLEASGWYEVSFLSGVGHRKKNVPFVRASCLAAVHSFVSSDIFRYLGILASCHALVAKSTHCKVLLTFYHFTDNLPGPRFVFHVRFPMSLVFCRCWFRLEMVFCERRSCTLDQVEQIALFLVKSPSLQRCVKRTLGSGFQAWAKFNWWRSLAMSEKRKLPLLCNSSSSELHGKNLSRWLDFSAVALSQVRRFARCCRKASRKLTTVANPCLFAVAEMMDHNWRRDTRWLPARA